MEPNVVSARPWLVSTSFLPEKQILENPAFKFLGCGLLFHNRISMEYRNPRNRTARSQDISDI